MARAVNIAILGLGVVGGGVEKILSENREIIKARLFRNLQEEIEIRLKWIFGKDLPKKEELKPLFTSKIEDITEDEDVDIVIETMGGIEPATSFIERCLCAGKHVISANKAAIATAGGKLEKLALENRVKFMYEASVGGTIPVLQGIRDGLVANEILSIRGIVNGTTNYILSAMYEEGQAFEDVLKKAQELGFAEADPASDVDGFDAMYKLAILCYLAYGEYPSLEGIKRESLRNVSLEDVANAKKQGKKLKYVASAEKSEDGTLDLSVSVQEIAEDDQLYGIDGVINAVVVECDRAQKVLFSGAGAGSQPTASAIISDLVRIIEYL